MDVRTRMYGCMDGCMDVRQCIMVGGLLLRNGWDYDDEIFTDYQNGASICNIIFLSACDQRGVVSTRSTAPLA